MIPVATAAEMRRCDQILIDQYGIPGLSLMELAGKGVAEGAHCLLKGDKAARIAVLCGTGNNGGDGLVAARWLYNWGYQPEVWVLGQEGSLSPDALANANVLNRMGKRVTFCPEPESLPSLEDLRSCALVIDAILGTGAKGEVKGLYRQVVERLSLTDTPVVAVDIPTGLDADTGAIAEVAVNATLTVTMGLLKLGHLLPPGCERCGEVRIVDIGVSPQIAQEGEVRQFLVEKSDVQSRMPKRGRSIHKGNAGLVYILAGSPGLTGAAWLAGEGALRSGAGLVVVGTPFSLNPILEEKLTEVMTEPLPETSDGYLSVDAWERVEKRLEWADAIAVGPGLGTHPSTSELILRIIDIIEKVKKPLIIDADGINLLAQFRRDLTKFPSSIALTPHPGELSRLTGVSLSEILNDRVRWARQFAAEWGITLHLKGAPSITACPEGEIFINSTGNQGMATGGSGDVLTGVITALCAAGVGPKEAVWMGAYIHGRAGDIAAHRKGFWGMSAGDIVDALPEAIREVAE